MAKRFIDSSLFEKDWFIALPDNHRMLWIYLFTRCDVGGVFDPNMTVMSAILKSDYTVKDILTIFDGKVIQIEDKLFLTTFIDVQYGFPVSPKMVKPINKSLSKVGLTLDTLKSHASNLKDYTVSAKVDTPKDKSKDIDIDKEKEKEQVLEQKAVISSAELSEARFNPKVTEIKTKWDKFAKKHGLAGNILLTPQRQYWILERLRETHFDIDLILSGIEKMGWGLGKEGYRITIDKILQDSTYYVKCIEANSITENQPQTVNRGTMQNHPKTFIDFFCKCGDFNQTYKRELIEKNISGSIRCPKCTEVYTAKSILETAGESGRADFQSEEVIK